MGRATFFYLHCRCHLFVTAFICFPACCPSSLCGRKPVSMAVIKLTFLKIKINYADLRYWLFWALLVGGLFYGVHRYFEYRTMELDKRLERLK